MGRTLLLAGKAQREIDALQRRGVTRARKLAIKLRQAANAAFTSRAGESPDYQKLVLKEMASTLRDAMLAAHLSGLLAERELLRKRAKRPLKLSVFDKTVAGLRDLLNLSPAGTRALQLQYQTQAIRILSDASDDVDAELRRTVSELISEGATVAEGRRVLAQELDRLGMTPRQDYRLETVFRTQTQMAYGAGRWEADQDPAVREILWGYEYSAVGDDRVRPEHEALDGTRLPKDDPLWDRIWPPNGWNCRCQVIPIFEEEEEVRPPEFLEDGVTPVEPDQGFAFNPGRVFASARTMARGEFRRDRSERSPRRLRAPREPRSLELGGIGSNQYEEKPGGKGPRKA